MGDWASLGSVEGRPDLGPASVDGLEIAVARLDDGSWAAFEDTCTHEECPLSEGDLDGERIICYCHSSEFDVRTGAVLRGPADEPIRVFETRIEADELQVLVG